MAKQLSCMCRKWERKYGVNNPPNCDNLNEKRKKKKEEKRIRFGNEEDANKKKW